MLYSNNWPNFTVWLPLWDIGQYMYCNCLLTRLWRQKLYNYSCISNQSDFSRWPKSQHKNVNILRTERAFKNLNIIFLSSLWFSDVFRDYINGTEACNFIKKEVLAQVCSCEFCKNSKSTLFYRTPPVTCSAYGKLWIHAFNSLVVSSIYLRSLH